MGLDDGIYGFGNVVLVGSFGRQRSKMMISEFSQGIAMGIVIAILVYFFVRWTDRRGRKKVYFPDKPTKPPKRTARQSGTVESFGEGLVPDYLVFTDEYGRRWRLESQYLLFKVENALALDALRSLAGEEQLTLKEIKDKYLPNRDLDELRGVTREGQKWEHPMTLGEVADAEEQEDERA